MSLKYAREKFISAVGVFISSVSIILFFGYSHAETQSYMKSEERKFDNKIIFIYITSLMNYSLTLRIMK